MRFQPLLLSAGSLFTLASAAASASSSSSVTPATEPLTIRGNKFFYPSGAQFFIKGISYQRSPTDPLVDGAQCKLDANLMATLGANTIRVYHVDANQNHDDCMTAFANVGIYMFIDLDTFNTQIEQDGPPHWNQTQLTAFGDVLDTFAAYQNVAGFFIGNEIITTSTGSLAAPYIKSAMRDIKKHIVDKKFDRAIYVGYSAADISELRPNLQNYLTCGDDNSVNIDFFGLNAYEWCGESSYSVSGYDQLTVNATNYPVPIFFSETGCNTPKPRTFGDQAAIFSSPMKDIWSGAIIYEWIQEANDYGLISYGSVNTATAVGGESFARGGTPTPVAPDFTNLKSAWASATPTGPSLAAYTTTFPAPACPDMTAGVWNVDAAAALPTLGETAGAITATGHSATTGPAGSATGTGTGSATGASRTSASTGAAATGHQANLAAAVGIFGAIALFA